MLGNTSGAYGAVARALHWSIALLVIAALVFVEIHEYFPRGGAVRALLLDGHYQFGLLVFALVWVRLGWRLDQVEPAITPPLPAWQRNVSHAVQWLFYALMAAQPALGLALTQAQGKAVSYLGIPIARLVAQSKPLASQIREVHEWSGNVMIGLIGVHVAISLWHHWVRRDDTLRRML